MKKMILALSFLLSGCAVTPCFDIGNPEYRSDYCVRQRAANREMDREWGRLQDSPPPSDYGVYGAPAQSPNTPYGSGTQYDRYGRPIPPQYYQQAPSYDNDPRQRRPVPSYDRTITTDQYGRPLQPIQPRQYPDTGRDQLPQPQAPYGSGNNVDQWGRPIQPQPQPNPALDPYSQPDTYQPGSNIPPDATPSRSPELWRK